MPIPGLSIKTKSPQDWRKKSVWHHQSHLTKHLGRFSGHKPNRGKKLLKALFSLVLVMLALISLGSIFILGWVAQDLPNPDKIIERSVALSTKIYDRTGQTLLYDIHGTQQRTMVELTDIPDYLKKATLVAEDRNFYSHQGFSITGIIRSVIKNTLTGSKVGGSTLTQQLVKNAILSPEKTYTRKIKEVILSYQIEKRFSKDEILKMYFNEIPYGSVAYGAEAAAQTYFGKSVRNLSLPETAILAALPQSPTYYSPYGSHTDALFARQKYILDEMAKMGYITDSDAQKAKAEKIEFKKKSDNMLAPHFVMYIKEYLTEKYGEQTVEQGGLKVVTTLDLYKQNIAEAAIKEFAEKNAKNWNANNAALVSLDPKTGQILAMVGSKNFFAESQPEGCTAGRDCLFDPQLNAALSPRQPGSSFKPIVYAAAFKKGYTPETALFDVVTKFKNYDGRDYEPKNYNLKEYGPVTMRQALAGSLNIPAVKTIYLTGVDNVINLAQDMGYTSLNDRSRFGLSLVLGGAEVRLLEHVNAFAVFAREGEWHPTSAILTVTDKNGNILEEYQPQEKKVLATQVARQINSILSDNGARAFIFGENNRLTLANRPVAAKTGTTNDYHDAWTVGYTPSLVTGVWVGNNNNREMKLGADGSVIAAPIWNSFMSKVLGDTPVETFQPPDPNTSNKPILNGELAGGGIKVKIDKISGKLATNLTPENLVEEKTFRQVHDILYYINKDDPAGNTPPDLNDEQYQRWEEAVQRWTTENNYINENPPAEYDDIHTLANQPRIAINYPTDQQSITSRNLSVQVAVSAPRGISHVDYYLNHQLLQSVKEPPYNLEILINDPTIKNGSYTLRAVAYDDVENSNSAIMELNLQLPD